MGVTGLRFKPTTILTPSHQGNLFLARRFAKWVEIGNSGMFRPEMLESMGLPKGLRVVGWGLSLEDLHDQI
ncbi:ASN_HP2_G0016400.mRNA.1.CDS.1 [Saccharomyces cerevisiae]|nr:ASN_HP2_G0016400.mRNA.1.CDS.1 [Saccharomyces cerevisiae]CAI6528726.1 ASN_HP2_G0016400.mRNA.1.CDS.1 [Saccharomyces cerevisiae]